MKVISSKFPAKNALFALVLGISFNGHVFGAEQISVNSEIQNPAITFKTENFTPGHPACTAKPAAGTAIAPVPASAPKTAVIIHEEDTDSDGIVNSKDECPDTPHGYKVDPKGCPVSVTLHIRFPFNSSAIPASEEGEAVKLAKIMKDNPPAKATIIGHTDSVGTDGYNQKLSEARSKALGDKLIENGVETERIETSGKGEKEPVASNDTAEGRAENRRIEVNLQ